MNRVKARSFEEARKFVRSLNLKNMNEYRKYCKSGKKPSDIPTYVNETYADKWIDWTDFLGSDPKFSKNKKFRSFEEARAFARKLNLSKTEWEIYRKSDKKPDDIPTNPQTIYKKEWKGWPDFLGTSNVSGRLRHMQFRSFTEARKFARSLNFKSRPEWEKHARAGKLPKDIPRVPDGTYKENGWTTWGDFLGTGNISSQNREYITHDEARKYARKLGLTGQIYWTEFAKKNKKLLEDLNIPASPSQVYKKEFKGYGDFLGTGTIQNSQREFWSFKKSRTFVRKIGLLTQTEWKNYCKSSKLPKEIPSNPNRTYKNEWKGMPDWLGVDKITNQEKAKNWLPAEEAKPIIQELAKKYGIKNRVDWTKFAKAHKELLEKLNIPAYPLEVYSKERIIKRLMK